MKLTDVVTDLESYTGEVFFPLGNLVVYGFINEQGTVTELFAEGEFGRSHRGCGTKHNIPLAALHYARLVLETT